MAELMRCNSSADLADIETIETNELPVNQRFDSHFNVTAIPLNGINSWRLDKTPIGLIATVRPLRLLSAPVLHSTPLSDVRLI